MPSRGTGHDSRLISVVIATRNRAALLARTLAALDRQTWPADRFEILVADNGSRDDTAAIVEQAASTGRSTVRYLIIREPGKSAAVNAALLQARGDLIAFTDDDVQPCADWLERLADAAASADFVAGRILPDWEVNAPSWLTRPLHGVLAVADNGVDPLPIARGTNEHVMPIGANMAVTAAAIRRVGGLRTDLGKLEGTLRTGEDHEFFLRLLRAGCRGAYEPRAVVSHFVPASRLHRAYFRKWLYQNGRDVSRLESAFPSNVPHLLGTPRYLWREFARDAARCVVAALSGDAATRFARELRIIWFAGYLRDRWFGTSRRDPSALLTAEGH